MSADPEEYLFVENRYGDFDRFEDDMLGWNLEFKQLDRGLFTGDLTFLATPDFHLFHSRLGRKLYQTGSPPPTFRTIGIPADPDVSFLWRGKKITGSDMFAFPVGGELNCVSGPNFGVFALTFPVDMLRKYVDRIAGSSGVRSFFEHEVMHCSDEVLQVLRQRLTGWLNQVRLGTGRLPSLSKPASVAFCQLFVEAWFEGTPRRFKIPAASRKRIVTAAVDLILDRSHDPITVGELCALTRTSRRTLDYAFKDRFGVAPRDFIQAHRLNNVRTDLKQADPGVTRVADIANRWGFWHMGKFAGDYRRFFGELPSETLRVGI